MGKRRAKGKRGDGTGDGRRGETAETDTRGRGGCVEFCQSGRCEYQLRTGVVGTRMVGQATTNLPRTGGGGGPLLNRGGGDPRGREELSSST